LIANWFKRQRGLAIGILQVLGGVGDTLMPKYASILILASGWRSAFMTLPLLLLVPFLALLLVVKNKPADMGLEIDGGTTEDRPDNAGTGSAVQPANVPMKPPGESRERAPSISLLRLPAFWLLSAVLFLTGWSTFAVWQHFVLFFRDEGFSPAVAASLYSMFLASSTVSRLVCGPLCDKIGATVTTALVMVMVAVATLSLVYTHNSALLYACIIVFGFGHGGTITTRPLFFFENFGSVGTAKFYGLATAIYSVGAFLGPGFSGRFYDIYHNYNFAFQFAFAMSCMTVIMTLLVRISAKRTILR
jgi:MFS family permease